ncbi:hypothetical protein TPHA_0F00710 [Tetrapisispora phaffii CBS 4417]|uniref:CMP/dCMP-type deaminase domain-containing protein n=1 Tax=Tetrapisispora phaffii (strain ATCC 24235 / CBS 4417 / NBRC 1672 / NRRL Y-8282 / UCD 70-5) TaxID=1071381 RepID=G8BUX5_TETPH|nr:hypothetical protein TPHA_0F00710 [Tetrapisispora phaffii CBS 4417]CCE63557.1 hypothetical protein TPHA_0F00710 [Tetrapisispora phaffii CBS 4417]
MVKKEKNPIKIDYENCIVEGCLVQVKNNIQGNNPNLIKVWTIDINPKDSGSVIAFIRKYLQKNDPVTFTHVKRIQPFKEKNILKIILCSAQLHDENSRLLLENLLNGYNNHVNIENESIEVNDKINDNKNRRKPLPKAFQFNNLDCIYSIPLNLPPTKDIMIEWSKKFWPLNWCGNPNDQILNDMEFNINWIRSHLKNISKLASELGIQNTNKKSIPVVTSFVSPLDPTDIITTIDERENLNPLDHSIMCGIKRVSELERSRRIQNKQQDVNYLCLNFDVYTTHEPCSMCSMALIHSRIKRLIFIKPMKKTGCLKPDSGDGYCMQDNKNLNSKYEVFQWIGGEFQDIPTVSDKICC